MIITLNRYTEVLVVSYDGEIIQAGIEINKRVVWLHNCKKEYNDIQMIEALCMRIKERGYIDTRHWHKA